MDWKPDDKKTPSEKLTDKIMKSVSVSAVFGSDWDPRSSSTDYYREYRQRLTHNIKPANETKQYGVKLLKGIGTPEDTFFIQKPISEDFIYGGRR